MTSARRQSALIEGQLVGGCVQGLGGALCEEFVYDKSGGPLSVTFADYLLPVDGQMPDIEVLSPRSALPAPSARAQGRRRRRHQRRRRAIAGAIDEALGMPGAVTELPLRGSG